MDKHLNLKPRVSDIQCQNREWLHTWWCIPLAAVAMTSCPQVPFAKPSQVWLQMLLHWSIQDQGQDIFLTSKGPLNGIITKANTSKESISCESVFRPCPLNYTMDKKEDTAAWRPAYCLYNPIWFPFLFSCLWEICRDSWLQGIKLWSLGWLYGFCLQIYMEVFFNLGLFFLNPVHTAHRKPHCGNYCTGMHSFPISPWHNPLLGWGCIELNLACLWLKHLAPSFLFWP